MKKISLMTVLFICCIVLTGCGKVTNDDSKVESNANKCNESYNCEKNTDGNYDCLYSEYDASIGDHDFDKEEKIVCSPNQIDAMNEIHLHE